MRALDGLSVEQRAALVLTYFIFAAAAMRLAIKTRDVVVPQLAGMRRTINNVLARTDESLCLPVRKQLRTVLHGGTLHRSIGEQT